MAIKRSFNTCQKTDYYSSYKIFLLFSLCLFRFSPTYQIDNLINWQSMIDHRNISVEFAKCNNGWNAMQTYQGRWRFFSISKMGKKCLIWVDKSIFRPFFRKCPSGEGADAFLTIYDFWAILVPNSHSIGLFFILLSR